MSRSITPLPRCIAPAACPAVHSLSSRTSTSRWSSPACFICWYWSMLTSRTRDFASFTRSRNPWLCFLACELMVIVDPFDSGPHLAQFALNILIAPVDVVHAIYYRFSLCSQGGEHERGTGAQVRCDHLGAR